MANKRRKAATGAQRPEPARPSTASRLDAPRLWALGLAAVAGLVAYLLTSNGFIVSAEQLQTGLLPGAVVGMVAWSLTDAALAAAIGVTVGVIVAPPWYVADTALWPAVGLSAVVVVVAIAVACSVRFLRGKTGALPLALIVLAFLAVNLAVSTVTVDRVDFEGAGSEFDLFRTPPTPEETTYDRAFFLSTYYKMKAGTPYYEAVQQIYRES